MINCHQSHIPISGTYVSTHTADARAFVALVAPCDVNQAVLTGTLVAPDTTSFTADGVTHSGTIVWAMGPMAMRKKARIRGRYARKLLHVCAGVRDE